jgi:UTP--glucose-1-phosphate uridylyltransferase
MLPDDIIIGDKPCMQQLIEIAQQEQAAVIGVIEVPLAEISAYGSIKKGTLIRDDLVEVVDIIEKPKPHEAFSNLAIIGRYVLPVAIFDAIAASAPHSSGEIQLTDALTYLTQHGHKVLAHTIKGIRFDIGRPAGWLAANAYLSQGTS